MYCLLGSHTLCQGFRDPTFQSRDAGSEPNCSCPRSPIRDVRAMSTGKTREIAEGERTDSLGMRKTWVSALSSLGRSLAPSMTRQ
jgi:hypothetical protein